MDNRQIAHRLLEHARMLDGQTNLYRVRAYRRAAQTILGLDQALTTLVEDGGRKRLAALAGIGRHLAFTIEGLVRTGEFRTWEGRRGLSATRDL